MHIFIYFVVGITTLLTAEITGCPLYVLPICGSDGKTYNNDCFMKTEALIQKKAIMMVHNGNCRPQDENDAKRCLFPCTMDFKPVCGHNKKLYPNECALRADACRLNQAISIVQRGQTNCSACNIRCTREYRPVCGSDGKTHATECVMQATACRTNTPIVKIRSGKC